MAWRPRYGKTVFKFAGFGFVIGYLFGVLTGHALYFALMGLGAGAVMGGTYVARVMRGRTMDGK